MVNGTAGLGDDSFTSDRRYRHPWSRSKSLMFLGGMLVFSALLTWGGIHVVNLTMVWQ